MGGGGGPHHGKGSGQPSTATGTTGTTANPEVVRDNYIPVFDGQPSSYKEYRKRVNLYYKKMTLANKKTEATINLLTSLAGPVWKQVEHLADSAPDDENGFSLVLQELDRVYQYDSRVEMPKAFERFFYGVNRPSGQTLIQYCSDHREAARELERHDVKLPDPVGGWLLLRRSSLTAEQRQLVMSQVDNKKLSVATVEQALFYLFGQDYKSFRTEGPRASGRGRAYQQNRWGNYRTYGAAYVTEEDENFHETQEYEYVDDTTDPVYYEEENEFYEEEDYEPNETEYYDPAYFGEEEEDEPVEEAYATYLDARRHLAEVKAGRGYYPVVAMTDHGTQLPVAAQVGGGKGKPAKGKMKGKPSGKGKAGKSGRGAPQQPKGMARAAATKCLRCGQAGHWAAQCPKPPAGPTSQPGSPTKRAKPSEAMMALLDTCSLSPKQFGICVGMQDGGASSMVGGHDVVMEVISSFAQRGLDPDTLAFTRTNKNFLFGGDHRCLADWSVHLPVWIGGVKGRIQCFLVSGTMPILIGRPLLKALKVKVDYDTDRVSVMGGRGEGQGRRAGEEWTTILKGPKGEHLLSLEDGLTEDTLHTDYQFDYVTDDCVEDFLADGVLHGLGDYLRHTGRDGPDFTMEEIMLEEDEANADKLEQIARFTRENAGLTPVVECPLPTSMWKSLTYGINRSKNELDRHLESAYRIADVDQATFWEVYSGSGNLSAAMRDLGFNVKSFDLPEWNFEDRGHRRAFFEMMDKEMPHVVWLAPPCTKWSPLQNFTKRSSEELELLHATRDYHHHTHLMFVRRVFLRMATLGVAVIEHPRGSRAWSTPALCDLGLEVIVDQCAMGAALPNERGETVPIMKTTKLAVNHALLVETLGAYRCDGSHRHQAVIGSCSTVGSRAKAAATYQPTMCVHLAEALQGAYYAHFVYGNATTEEAMPASDVDMEEYEPSDAPPPEEEGTTWTSPPMQTWRLSATLEGRLRRRLRITLTLGLLYLLPID